MAKPDTSRIDTLEAIMAEKRKHESYLAKLEERRASTPAHVFNRLRDEYLTKLTDLQVRASMEAESLSEGLKADEAAVAEIEARLAVVTEERIEGELRAEVGEYDPKEWGKKLEALNATIGQIEKERAAKVAAFERTRSLLTEARGAAAPADVPPAATVPAPPAAPAPAPVAATPAPSTAPAIPELFASAPAATPAPAVPPIAPRVSSPTPAKAPEPAPVARQTPMGQPPAAVPPAAPAAEPAPVIAPRTSSPTPAAPAAASAAPVPEPSSAPVSPPPAAPTSAPAPAPMAGSPSFDELAFLNSVVGRTSSQMKPDPSVTAEPRPSGAGRAMPTPAPVPPVVPPARSTTNVRPPVEGDDTASGPLGRPTPRTSQAIKTLKCQECGTLNYPTEWYCERCGGELAAL